MDIEQNTPLESLQEGRDWIYLFMDEKVSEFTDIGFSCFCCGHRHSLYIPCPYNL